MAGEHVGVIMPKQLIQWVDEEAQRRGVTRSRCVNEIINEVSGLDVPLRRQGRKPSAHKEALKEIEDATGQVLAPGSRLPRSFFPQ